MTVGPLPGPPHGFRWADRYRQLGVDGAWRTVRTAAPQSPQDAAANRPQDHARTLEAAPDRVGIAGELGLPASTVHAVLVRCRMNRLSHVDRATGEPVRR